MDISQAKLQCSDIQGEPKVLINPEAHAPCFPRHVRLLHRWLDIHAGLRGSHKRQIGKALQNLHGFNPQSEVLASGWVANLPATITCTYSNVPRCQRFFAMPLNVAGLGAMHGELPPNGKLPVTTMVN